MVYERHYYGPVAVDWFVMTEKSATQIIVAMHLHYTKVKDGMSTERRKGFLDAIEFALDEADRNE